MNEYTPFIGLETHIQLNTKTKAFCACRADSWNDPPNTNICPVCTGQPGALPSPNAEMVRKALRLCAALHAKINKENYFDRKNYLYADMPGGYQISQNDQPVGVDGYLDVDMEDGRLIHVRINNLHMEEDAGKTKNEGGVRLIDLNRAGVPLVEVVTCPDLHSADEAAAFLVQLRQLIRWIGVSEGNMEKAQLRSDVNVSLSPKGSGIPGRKCEIKNINTIDAVRKAISSEIARQTRELEAGHSIEQWTIEWDNDAQELRKMRSKENAVDYRYFREPNLMPVLIPDVMIEAVRSEMPELPREKRLRFCDQYSLPVYDSKILTGERDVSEYFEEALSSYGGDPRRVSNWMMNDILRIMHDNGCSASGLRIRPKDLADIIRMVDDKTINTSTGRSLVNMVQESGRTPAEIVKEKNLGLVSDEAMIREVCGAVIRENPEEAAAWRAGKETLLSWFTGQVMRRTRGKAAPKLVSEVLKELLQKSADSI